jgi:hypothetical protein
MLKTVANAFFVSMCAASQAMAMGNPGGGGHGFGGGGGGAASAPEFDGPGGVAAIALLVSAGIIAYNRYRKK